MLIQIFRAVAESGGCPPECRDWLQTRNLDSLGGLIPPLVDLVQTALGAGAFARLPDQGPTVTEQGLLGAVAISMRDPEECQRMLGSILPPKAAQQAEDWVRAIDFVLRDQYAEGVQSAQFETVQRGVTIH